MRTKFILFLFLFSRLVYSQVTIGAIEKKEEKIVLKPPPYDSLKNFEDQYPSFIDYRQYIGLQVYLPPSFSSDVSLNPLNQVNVKPSKLNNQNDSIVADINDFTNDILHKKIDTSNIPLWGDKYFTIIDVLKHTYKKGSGYWHPIFILRNNSNGDTLCWDVGFGYKNICTPFILVPYFIKLKKLYQNKKFIYHYLNYPVDIITGKRIKIKDGDILTCTEVTLLKVNEVFSTEEGKTTLIYTNHEYYESDYGIFLVLENDGNEKIAMRPGEIDSRFVFPLQTIEEEENKRIENEKKAKTKRRAECIKKFGQHYGELVAEKKVEIGMTKEMCKVAWGFPYDTFTTTTALGTNEHWFYSWKYNLYFLNGILTKIER